VIGQAEEDVDFPLIWLYHHYAIGPIHLRSTIIGVRRNCSNGFVSSVTTFWFHPLIFHLCFSRFFVIYAYMMFDENTSGLQRKIELCNIHSTQ
jgi:hypothetical protein